MGKYKLSEEAKADLIRIHQHGVREYGQTQADKYYAAFFERFEQLARQPYLYQAVDDIREGYRRSVCGVDSIYYRVDDDRGSEEENSEPINGKGQRRTGQVHGREEV